MRLWAALGAMVLVGFLASRTLSDEKLRLATLLVLGFFAMKIVIAHRKEARTMEEHDAKDSTLM